MTEPISPELALVDPELARRARALLPAPEVLELGREDVATAPSPGRRRFRVRRDLLTRAAAWLAVPSIALNVAYLRTDAAADRSPVSAPPRVVTVTVAPTAPRSDRPVRRPRRSGVASARHERAPRSRPAATDSGGVLRWRGTTKAATYDVVVWRGHRRIADVWTAKPKITVARLACRGSRPLPTGRYLWFVYPLLDAHPRRYGRLAKWGTFVVDARTRCLENAKPAR